MNDNTEYEKLIDERFAALPSVVQDAIVSVDVEAHLRELANKHQLHVDQWQTLANEVQLTLLGVKLPSDLTGNLEAQLNVSANVAEMLANDISEIVFEPIRQELERQLDHPDAKRPEVSDMDTARAQVLANQPQANNPQTASEMAGIHSDLPLVIPATPPTAPPDKKVERAQIAPSYKSGEVSAQRSGPDPYREPTQ